MRMNKRFLNAAYGNTNDMNPARYPILLTWVYIAFALVGSLERHAFAQEASFHIHGLAVDANEGIAAADVDQDGKTDLVAGRCWYRNGDWLPRPLRSIDDWNGYVQSNGDYVFDVNADGFPDVVAGSFLPTEIHWYENPGKKGLKLGQLWETTFAH